MRDSLLDKVGVDGDALGAVVSLVDADQSVRELKHVRPKRFHSKMNRRDREPVNLREMMMN